MWLLCGPVTLNKHSINKLDLYQLLFRWSRRRCSAGRLAYWLCRKHNSVVWLSYCWCFFLSLCATICFRPRVRLRSRRFVSHRAVHSCEQEEVQVLVIWQQWYSWDLYLSLLFFLTTGQVSELVSYTVNTAGCVGPPVVQHPSHQPAIFSLAASICSPSEQPAAGGRREARRNRY